MKAKIIFTIILGLFSFVSNAQFRWGLEAGVNISHALETSDTRAGFNIGVVGEYCISTHWFTEAALKLSSQPIRDKYWNGYQPSAENAFFDKKSYTPYYLTLPVRFGYKCNIVKSLDLSLAVGPMIGLGAFGSGRVSSTYYDETNLPTEILNQKVDGIFGNERYKFSSSRFQYGANIKAGLTYLTHYRLSAEYNIIHIPGDYKTIDNISLFSISLGYIF